jgi:uncharacterized membrane protein (UPF0127 family)
VARLFKTSNGNAELLIENLSQAHSFFERGIGLLTRKSLAMSEGLWIDPCRDIHTFFMKFSIDCIFLDDKMEIYKIAANVKPFRFVGPYWRARSVIEVPAGFSELKKLKVGDQVYVVD